MAADQPARSVNGGIEKLHDFGQDVKHQHDPVIAHSAGQRLMRQQDDGDQHHGQELDNRVGSQVAGAARLGIGPVLDREGAEEQ